MVKPDGVQRGLVGNVISRFENKGFQIIGLKMYHTSKDVAEEHYKDLKSKPFYGKLVDYIISGPVVCIVRFALNLFLIEVLCAYYS
jgi:nucleoside-diphosphate kinase